MMVMPLWLAISLWVGAVVGLIVFVYAAVKIKTGEKNSEEYPFNGKNFPFGK